MEAMVLAIDCHVPRLPRVGEMTATYYAFRRVQEATASKHLDDEGIEEQKAILLRCREQIWTSVVPELPVVKRPCRADI